ncbi:MAG: CarD family transcriptional regulator, partial [archaeon]
MLNKILKNIKNNEQLLETINIVKQKKHSKIITSNIESKALIAQSLEEKLVIICSNLNELIKFENFFKSIGKEVVTFKNNSSSYIYQKFNKHSHILDKYPENIFKVVKQEFDVLLIMPSALMQKLPIRDIFSKNILTLKSNMQKEPKQITDELIKQGYNNLNGDVVQNKSEFSLRGDILDLFPVNDQLPIRINFFDDTIESIYKFNPITQKKVKEISKKEVSPNRILFLEYESQEKIRQAIDNEIENMDSNTKENFEYIKQEIFLDWEFSVNSSNLFWLTPYFLNFTSNILHYVEDIRKIYSSEIDLIRQLEEEYFDFYNTFKNLFDSKEVLAKHKEYYFDKDKLITNLKKGSVLSFDFSNNQNTNQYYKYSLNINYNQVFEIPSTSMIDYSGNFDLLKRHLREYLKNDKYIFLAARSTTLINYISNYLKKNQFKFQVIDDYSYIQQEKINIIKTGLLKGVDFLNENIVIFGNNDLFISTTRGYKETSTKTDLPDQVGDYVVHDVHGIGIYKGIKKLNLSGYERDYVILKYKNNDT